MVAAPAPQLQPDAPLTYVVKRGDTLWDISKKFLIEPWQWPEIWVANSHVKNPHLIYPGDVLVLTRANGRAQLSLSGENKLEPHLRESSLDSAIPTIPLDAIRDFLHSSRLVTPEEIERAPYIVDFVESHLVGGQDNPVYVRKLFESDLPTYEVVRVGERYVDPDTDEFLGLEAIPVGTFEARERGSAAMPGMGNLSRTEREAYIGDYLLPPRQDQYTANFHPHPPARDVRARIISVLDGVSHIGQYAVVTLNRGARDGLDPGTMLAARQAERRARDPIVGGWVNLPETYSGLIMVFKVEEKVSYGLVLKAVHEIRKFDFATRPIPGER